jgi:tRNA A37 threonylcarbamoyladenosine dehydratase
MICLIAGNYEEALTFAKSQFLARNEWFYPRDEDELKRMSNFHVLVVGSAGHNVPSSYFDRFYALAQTRGRIGRL